MKFKDTQYGDLTNKEHYTISVRGCDISSLEGCPKKIKGNFNCSFNNLTSLEYSPQIVTGNFYCFNNKLETLKGSPIEVGEYFSCGNNNLTSLEHRPKLIKGEFNCQMNKKLKNIKEQIIKYQIKAEYYSTDEGRFYFNEIKEKFEEFGNFLLKKEQLKINKKQIKNKIINNKDFGLGI